MSSERIVWMSMLDECLIKGSGAVLSSVAGLQCSRPGMLSGEENIAPAELSGSLCILPVLTAIPM